MLGEDGMKFQLEDIIYKTPCVKKSNSGEKIVFHFSQLHISAQDETPALLPIETLCGMVCQVVSQIMFVR